MAQRTLVASATNLLARGFLVVATDRKARDGSPVNALFAVARAIHRVIAHRALDADDGLRHVAVDAGTARTVRTVPRMRRHARGDLLMAFRAQRVAGVRRQLRIPIDVGQMRIGVLTGPA